MVTTADAPLDETRVEAFAGKLFDLYTGGALSLMVDIGFRTGLFEAAAAGPATSTALAERAGLDERYVREWLGAMATGRLFEYDPARDTYRLPEEHAVCLTGDGSTNMAPFSQLIGLLGEHLDGVTEAFRTGGGVPYERFRPRFTSVTDAIGRGLFDQRLLDGILPLAGDLPARLATGARVADIGCGTGHALNLMATAYPASDFIGYDISEEAVEARRCGCPMPCSRYATSPSCQQNRRSTWCSRSTRSTTKRHRPQCCDGPMRRWCPADCS
jgi:hypothetical protein